MATARSIVTLGNLKLYLGASATTATDTALEYFIDIISGWMEERVGTKIAAQSVTEYLDGDGTPYLSTSYMPVSLLDDSLDNLQYRSSFTDAPLWTNLLDSIEYLNFGTGEEPRLQLLGGLVFPIGQKNIKITYIAGWTDIPAPLTKVCLEAVQNMWDEAKTQGDRLGKQAEAAGGNIGGNVSYLDLNLRWEEIFAQYRPRTTNVPLTR